MILRTVIITIWLQASQQVATVVFFWVEKWLQLIRLRKPKLKFLMEDHMCLLMWKDDVII